MSEVDLMVERLSGIIVHPFAYAKKHEKDGKTGISIYEDLPELDVN